MKKEHKLLRKIDNTTGIVLLMAIAFVLGTLSVKAQSWTMGLGVSEFEDKSAFEMYADFQTGITTEWGFTIGFYGDTGPVGPSSTCYHGGYYTNCSFHDGTYKFGYDDGGWLIGVRHGRKLTKKLTVNGTIGANIFTSYYYDGYYSEETGGSTDPYFRISFKYNAGGVTPELGYGSNGTFVGIGYTF